MFILLALKAILIINSSGNLFSTQALRNRRPYCCQYNLECITRFIQDILNDVQHATHRTREIRRICTFSNKFCSIFSFKSSRVHNRHGCVPEKILLNFVAAKASSFLFFLVFNKTLILLCSNTTGICHIFINLTVTSYH
jgi:hypothetical protein